MRAEARSFQKSCRVQSVRQRSRCRAQRRSCPCELQRCDGDRSPKNIRGSLSAAFAWRSLRSRSHRICFIPCRLYQTNIDQSASAHHTVPLDQPLSTFAHARRRQRRCPHSHNESQYGRGFSASCRASKPFGYRHTTNRDGWCGYAESPNNGTSSFSSHIIEGGKQTFLVVAQLSQPGVVTVT